MLLLPLSEESIILINQKKFVNVFVLIKNINLA
jgi:hypothetical protein